MHQKHPPPKYVFFNSLEYDWILAKEVLSYSSGGHPQVFSDALNQKSSTLFGYEGNFVRANVSKTENSKSIFDGFEEYKYTQCKTDGDLDIIEEEGVGEISTEFPHTGKYSLKILPKEKLEVEYILKICDE